MQATHIPYRGTGPAVTDLLAGQVDFFVAGTEALMQHVKAGRLRALAVTTAQRLAAYPDIPSVAEAALPEYDVVAWHGLIAPRGVPPAVLSRLHSALDSGLHASEVIAQLGPTGVSPAGGSAEQFGKLIKTEIARYGGVVRDNHIRAD